MHLRLGAGQVMRPPPPLLPLCAHRHPLFASSRPSLPPPTPHSYVIDDTPAARPGQTAGDGQKLCSEALAEVQARYDAQAAALERIRAERLPGR